MNRIVVIAVCLLPLVALGQKSRKSKVSNGRGTLYGYIGYNRSIYSSSKLDFTGPGYNFSLDGVKASDVPTPFTPSVQLNPMNFSVAQYNIRIGYYIRTRYALSLGYDKFKYAMNDANQVLLNGTINPGVDNVTSWSGDYMNQEVTTSSSTFDYRNAGGLNYIRLELMRTDMLFKVGSKSWFALSTNIGAGLGALYSNTAFRFAGRDAAGTGSFSGMGLSAHGSLRAEFFRHFFLQTGLSGGYMHQFRVATDFNEPNASVKHHFGYGSFETVVGFLLYVRPTNDCNSCPVW